MALYESEVTKREGVGGGRGLVGVACASVADKGVDDGEEHGARGFVERGDGVDAVAAAGLGVVVVGHAPVDGERGGANRCHAVHDM